MRNTFKYCSVKHDRDGHGPSNLEGAAQLMQARATQSPAAKASRGKSPGRAGPSQAQGTSVSAHAAHEFEFGGPIGEGTPRAPRHDGARGASALLLAAPRRASE